MGEYGYQSFSERMQDHREAADSRPARCFIPSAVTYQRPKRDIVTVTEAAELLGVTVQRMRQLLCSGRIVGAFKNRTGRREWTILLTDARPTVSPGTRGPQLQLLHKSTLPF